MSDEQSYSQKKGHGFDRVPLVCLVGAGLMGASIAVALASAGFAVKLKEIDENALSKGLKTIDELLKRMVDKGLSQIEAEKRHSLIEPVKSFEDLGDAEFAIEAVTEAIEVKRKVFEQLDKHCQPNCILASNTSSLSISQIASFTGRAEKVIGLHFFNPAHIMRLVEVIPGIRTAKTTVDAAITFGEKLGKLAIRVDECPSFLVNRLLACYLNEALWMVQGKRATVEVIDAAACKLLMPLGPLALRVARFNFGEYGERFEPPPILEKMVQSNMLGRKTFAGFYNYDLQTRKSTGINPEFLRLLDSVNADEVGTITEEEAIQLFLPMINEAFLVLQEKICAANDLDPALKAGLGMRKGPLEFAFELGLPTCLKEIERLFELYGERFRPAPLLKRYVFAKMTSLN
jgi:3-hydroxyacyl-CoA dehydrogenase